MVVFIGLERRKTQPLPKTLAKRDSQLLNLSELADFHFGL